MELFIAFSLLFGLWLIGRMMNSKIQDNEQKNFEKLTQSDPKKVVEYLKQELRNSQIDLKKSKLLGEGINTIKYHQESCRLIEFAQLLAIDLSVNALNFRGPLFHEYRKGWTTNIQTKYDSYKQEFISTGEISKSFIQALNASPKDTLFANTSEINRQFKQVHHSTLRYLKLAGVSN